MVRPWFAFLPPPAPATRLEPALPVHKIPAATLHEDLVQLEREGESPEVQFPVVVDGTTQYFVVHTKFHGNNVETRGYETPADIAARLRRVSHEARLGADPLLRAFVDDDIVRSDA